MLLPLVQRLGSLEEIGDLDRIGEPKAVRGFEAFPAGGPAGRKGRGDRAERGHRAFGRGVSPTDVSCGKVYAAILSRDRGVVRGAYTG